MTSKDVKAAYLLEQIRHSNVLLERVERHTLEEIKEMEELQKILTAALGDITKEMEDDERRV